jgi:hypothetical protein
VRITAINVPGLAEAEAPEPAAAESAGEAESGASADDA